MLCCFFPVLAVLLEGAARGVAAVLSLPRAMVGGIDDALAGLWMLEIGGSQW